MAKKTKRATLKLADFVAMFAPEPYLFVFLEVPGYAAAVARDEYTGCLVIGLSKQLAEDVKDAFLKKHRNLADRARIEVVHKGTTATLVLYCDLMTGVIRREITVTPIPISRPK